jgi:tRNASer (uridine44-2'-O)-methyltransferase
MEGYEGYGFDARTRKTWKTFPSKVQECLHEKILIPHFLDPEGRRDGCHNGLFHGEIDGVIRQDDIQNGIFRDGEFLISNHSDELTPWTPLLAALTPNSGFLAIPCCEHDFSGAKVSGGLAKVARSECIQGRYAVYCEWICQISRAMGWIVEKEMLRIPSTRNMGIIGRKIDSVKDREKALALISEFGGKSGYHGFIDKALSLKDRVHRSH